jgi:hypothetical protein
MLVLQESMEYEYYINAPVAGQTLASLSVNQLINDNQEEIDPVNNVVIDDNNPVNNTPTTEINPVDVLNDIEGLFN